MNDATNIDATTRRFLQYWKDRNNWGGTPMCGGNVGGEPADKGYIVNMKTRGWVRTFRESGDVFIEFTDEGRAMAKSLTR